MRWSRPSDPGFISTGPNSSGKRPLQHSGRFGPRAITRQWGNRKFHQGLEPQKIEVVENHIAVDSNCPECESLAGIGMAGSAR